MTDEPYPGRLITLDGIDGVGKSTQIDRLRTHLEESGRGVVSVRDPGGTEIGKRLREILLDSQIRMHRRTEAMLFMASRCELVETVILPALGSGQIVLADRFLLSNVVYQSVDGGEPPQRLWELGRLANRDLRPDLTLLLDMPAAIAMRRIDRPPDRMEARGVEYLESVRQAFLRELPHSAARTVRIDAGQDVEWVAREVRRAVDAFLASPASVRGR